MNYNDFNWHDAVIKNIQIDRTNPGIRDTITFKIEWPDEKGKAILVFEKVYWADMKLNFGIVAEETIFDSTELENDNQDLADLYNKWNGAINDVNLKTYKIELNSTGGEIKIIANSFKVDQI